MRPSMRGREVSKRQIVVMRLVSTEDNWDIEAFMFRRDQRFTASPPGPGVNKWIFKHKGVAYMGDAEDFEPVPALEILAGLEKTKPRRKS